MRKLTASADTGPAREGAGRFAVPYDRGHACRCCRDVLRACCGRIDGDTPFDDATCCECLGWSHTSQRPGQVAVSPSPAYL